MDPASAIITFVSTGFTIISKINEIRKAIRDAPEQVQALQDSSTAVGLLLSKIQVAGCRGLSRSLQIDAYFHSLHTKSQDCLRRVDETVERVVVQCSTNGRESERAKIRLNLKRWIMDKGVLADLTGKLTEVRKALCEMLEFLQTNYLEHIADRIDNVEHIVSAMSSVQTYHSTCLEYMVNRMNVFEHAFNATFTPAAQLEDGRSADPPTGIAGEIGYTQGDPCPSTDPLKCEDIPLVGLPTVLPNQFSPVTKLRTDGPLKCPPNCECRCHYPSVTRLVPNWLTSFMGQISVSKRLFHPTFSPWSLCNISNCRGDLQQAITVQWILPSSGFHGHLHYRKDRRVHFSICAPRVIPWDSPIIHAVLVGDLQGVRNLFATGQASIWDYMIDGLPVFWYACNKWQESLNEEHLEIIRFFVEAGAEALLFESAETVYSAHDRLVLGLFGYLLLDDTRDKRRSIATVMRTNMTAINVFRSLFDIDAMDAIEDFLDRERAPYYDADIYGFVTSLEELGCDPASRSSVFEVTGSTPLAYAIYFSPESMESLLAYGEDATMEPTLAYAASNGRSELIKPLLNAGADIGMRDRQGYTALLVACSLCRYHEFFELLRWTEDDIDWNACTPNGLNALELFDSGVLEGWATEFSQSEIDEFRAVLVNHMQISEDVSDRLLDMPGAFPDAS